MIIGGKEGYPCLFSSVSKPNKTFEPVCVVNLLVPDDVADEFAVRGHKLKQFDEGKALIIKRKCSVNGVDKKQPKLMDKNNEEIDVLIGNGSKLRVQCNEYDWEYAGRVGKSLDLQAVQVMDLVEYSKPDGSEFLEEEEEF